MVIFVGGFAFFGTAQASTLFENAASTTNAAAGSFGTMMYPTVSYASCASITDDWTVRGVTFPVFRASGSGTRVLQLELYAGDTLIASSTTFSLTGSSPTSPYLQEVEFSTPVRLSDYCNTATSQSPSAWFKISSTVVSNSGNVAVRSRYNNTDVSPKFTFWEGTGITDTADWTFLLEGYTGAFDWGALVVAPPIDFGAIQFVATSTSLFSNGSTSLTAIAGQCDDSGNLFSRGLCYGGVFLFIPNPSTLDAFFSIPTTAATKFPFSWIYGVKSQFDTLAASSTANMLTLSFNMANFGLGSTTAMGNILPNFTGFSTSTITSYIGTSMWNTFQNLIVAVLWLGFIVHVYHFARGLAHPHG